MIARRTTIHQHVSTWGALIGAAMALATVIFTAGDANERLLNVGKSADATQDRVTKLEHDFGDMKASLARIEQAEDDTRATVHRLERGHVVHRVEDN